ncbi:ATP-binding cassette domain-containing protein [Streptomyces sp. S1A(2023)]
MIEIRKLTKRYGSRTAVDDLTFTVRPGAVTGFLGPNGAGKSTTMRMLFGLTRPDAGAALINGHPYPDLAFPARRVGALLETSTPHRGLTAAGHLSWIARSNGIPRGRVSEVLDQVGLADVARRRIGGFSLGMAQRLGLAAALLGDPEILVLDEPVNGLDAEGIRWLRRLLRARAEAGGTVLVSSHLMTEMSLVADHLIVVHQGRLLVDTGMTDFIRLHGRPHLRVHASDINRLASTLTDHGATVQVTHDGGIEVRGITEAEISRLSTEGGHGTARLGPADGSLEETFLELIDQHSTGRQTGPETRNSRV